jgi:hypothetical protein
MEPERQSPCSEKAATLAYPQPIESSKYAHSFFDIIHRFIPRR